MDLDQLLRPRPSGLSSARFLLPASPRQRLGGESPCSPPSRGHTAPAGRGASPRMVWNSPGRDTPPFSTRTLRFSRLQYCRGPGDIHVVLWAVTLRSSVCLQGPPPLRPAGGFQQLPGLCSLPPPGFMGTSLLSATSRCSRPILGTPRPSPRISPFSQQPASLCRGAEPEAAVWVLALLRLPGCGCFQPLSRQQRTVYIISRALYPFRSTDRILTMS